MTKLKVLDLFSGIGGFSLGLERTGGFETVAFCEIEPFPRRVLAKHWPKVPCYDDVRTLTADTLRRDGIAVDVICGGFPCQDISFAGNGAGIAHGTRSGLWSEYARLIGELRPQFVIVENVAALLGRGLDRVLGDLAAVGYDAEWHCIPASAIGAPHRRDRLWVVGHTAGSRLQGCSLPLGRWEGDCQRLDAELAGDGNSQRGRTLANTECGIGKAQHKTGLLGKPHCQEPTERFADGYLSADRQWGVEPNVGRVAHGVPQRVDRLKGLGNAVVPQIPELIGRAILQSRLAA